MSRFYACPRVVDWVLSKIPQLSYPRTFVARARAEHLHRGRSAHFNILNSARAAVARPVRCDRDFPLSTFYIICPLALQRYWAAICSHLTPRLTAHPQVPT
uniref:Uncharacterized protein n=1 Tax=Physcomitrium patens TaxID=3218 RepID=A0A2K1KLY3_PHYPA|nr:hypothetical protein PHYPA_005675 [Physcomitrium patens]